MIYKILNFWEEYSPLTLPSDSYALWICISGRSHNDHRVETVNLGIKWSHQLGLQVGLGSCSRGLQHCRAAAKYPFCSKYGRQLLPRPARCGVPMQPPASSPPFQPPGATHQMFPPRLVMKPNFCSDFEQKVSSRFWSWSSGKIFKLEFGRYFAADVLQRLWSWILVEILKLGLF